MISLGGAIGTGLFLGSGEVIAQTGPVGAIISYLLGGIIAYMVMLCLGELAVHMPESGSFGAYAKRYIGPGTGYTITWLILADMVSHAWNRIYCCCTTHAGMVPR